MSMVFYLDEPVYDRWILEAAIATPYSVEENIRRGNEAMRHVISSHKMEPRAMYRKKIGWIGFEWGTPGEEPPEFASHEEFRKWQKSGRRPYDKGGHGISHIIAKRDWENRHIQEFKGTISGREFVYKLVDVIARGEITSSSMKTVIKHDGIEAILWRRESGKEIIWLITGYSVVEKGYQYVWESAVGIGGVDCPDPSLRMNDDNWAGQTWERQTQTGKKVATRENEVNNGWLYDL